MFIVINCLGMPFNGETIKGSSLGGSETAAYYVAKELASKGHRVSVFTASEQEGVWDGVKYVYAGQVTEQTPLGDRFHYYAENTPHDVLIIQRHPYAFRYRWASKVNLWWVHDLAMIRHADDVKSQLWNIDGILTVSEFHKQQFAETYGLNPDIIYPIQNGIDLDLFKGDHDGQRYALPSRSQDQRALLYTSRPERGLEHLLAYNGIMERLESLDSRYHLYFCGYSNTTPQMVDYYNYLKMRAGELSNVTDLGHLTKQQLADVMLQCDALVYPTPGPQQPDFEEVSCITAMEAMAAGLPFISSKAGALPETCKDSGSILLPLGEGGLPDVQTFVDTIVDYVVPGSDKDVSMSDLQKKASKNYTWDVSANMLLSHIETIFDKSQSDNSVAKQLLRDSDIYALDKFMDLSAFSEDSITEEIGRELDECYQFAFSDDPKVWEDHYEKYYAYEAERGVDYGPEDLSGNDRFEYVSHTVSLLPEGATVLDYGCAHGHYTINLAKRYPNKTFLGVDLARSNIEKANKWASDEGVPNVSFIHGAVVNNSIHVLSKRDEDVSLDSEKWKFDLIIAAEVLEHVKNPGNLTNALNKYLKEVTGKMCITVPFGPWEAQGYEQHYPWRAHLWHFDRQDLHDMFGEFPDYNVAVAPSSLSRWGRRLGSHIVTYNASEDVEVGPIDYDRKFSLIKPLQTLSVCMIVHNAEDTLLKTLNSVKGVADEVVLAIDPKTDDSTMSVVNTFKESIKAGWPIVKVVEGVDPLDKGFDEARNESISHAQGDWVMWVDCDEILVKPENIYKYLRNNQFDGYAIKQHHFTVEPLGVMKTDMPCRLFRNNIGVKFFGVVHEHPEVELNKGVGHVQLIHDVEIAHQGYTTEAIRRNRFNRNISLLVEDREKYPERVLGKFLWLRDLAQMCRYELEVNGGRITNEMLLRAEEGIKLWEDLLNEEEHLRMLVDGIEFYDILSRIKGGGFEVGFVVDTSKLNGGVSLDKAQPIVSYFSSKEHAEKLFKVLFNERVKDYGSKYF